MQGSGWEVPGNPSDPTQPVLGREQSCSWTPRDLPWHPQLLLLRVSGDTWATLCRAGGERCWQTSTHGSATGAGLLLLWEDSMVGHAGLCWVILGRAGSCWVVLCCARLYWVVLGCPGSCWVVLGCAGSCWVILGHTGLYWVLLGHTGLCWVILGFMGSYWVMLLVWVSDFPG